MSDFSDLCRLVPMIAAYGSVLSAIEQIFRPGVVFFPATAANSAMLCATAACCVQQFSFTHVSLFRTLDSEPRQPQRCLGA